MILLKKFQIKNITENFTKNDILNISNIMINSNSTIDFYDKIEQKGLKKVYKNICDYDLFFNQHFSDEMQTGYSTLRNNFTKTSEMNKLIRDIIELTKNNRDWVSYFTISALMKVASDILHDPINVYKKDIFELLSVYNGDIDIFLFSVALFTFLKVNNNGQIKKMISMIYFILHI
jgi:hypothetical protein